MDSTWPRWIGDAAGGGVGLAVVVSLLSVPMFLVWRGGLSRRAYVDAPPREVGLAWVDVLLVVGYVVSLVALAAVALRRAGPDVAGTGAPRLDAGAMLVQQAMIQGPMVAIFIWRVMTSGVSAVAARVGEDAPPWVAWGEALRSAGLLPRRVLKEMWAGASALPVGIGLTLVVSGVAVTLWRAASGTDPPEVAHTVLESMVREGDPWTLLALLVPLVVVAPILEEAIFRGYMQTAVLAAWGRWRGMGEGPDPVSHRAAASPGCRWAVVVVASVLFAAVHAGVASPVAFPALFTLAVVLGWLYERTGSIWPGVVVHAGFNMFNIAAVLTMGGGGG